MFDPRGGLLKPVYVFVNAESMYKADLARPVTAKDELISGSPGDRRVTRAHAERHESGRQ